MLQGRISRRLSVTGKALGNDLVVSRTLRSANVHWIASLLCNRVLLSHGSAISPRIVGTVEHYYNLAVTSVCAHGALVERNFRPWRRMFNDGKRVGEKPKGCLPARFAAENKTAPDEAGAVVEEF